MQSKSIYESQQFTTDLILSLCKKADDIRKFPEKYRNSLEDKVLATLFYEPSTRTRLSFESAMIKLGGKVIGTENAAEFSSAVKGESLQDTIRVVSRYCDCIVLRHNTEGMAKLAAEISSVPIINAGDGKGQHPTQALTDVYTIQREFNRLENLNVTMVGDLAYGRTVRSLAYLLAKFRDNSITFIAPPNLQIGADIKDYLNRHKISFKEQSELFPALETADVIYMTRIQKERMLEGDYNTAKGRLSINNKNLQQIKKSCRIFHPLPHQEEIDLSLEIEQTDARVAYFRQAENGLYARMALLENLLLT